MNEACGPYIAAWIASATTVVSTISQTFSESSIAKNTNTQTAAATRPAR
jgi:hypothetical protein